MLKRHEGFRSSFYKDSLGHETIGYGRLITEAKGISEAEAEHLLNNDIYEAIRHLDKYPWAQNLDQVRYEALVDFMFNVGPNTFAKFKKMITALENGLWEDASNELIDSRYAKQVGYRAHELSYMITFGRYPSKEELDVLQGYRK